MISSLLEWVRDALADVFVWLLDGGGMALGAAWKFIRYLLESAWDVVGLIMSWGLEQLPPGWREFITTQPFATELWVLADGVDWFIPWKACAGIWIFSTMVVGIIRLVRWILGIQILGFSVNS